MSRSSVDPAGAPGAARSGCARPAPTRSDRGAISWVTLLLLVLVGGGAYLAWTWVPVYVDHYEAKQVVHDFMNQAVKNRDDAGLRAGMVQRIQRLREVDGADAYGRAAKFPAIPLDERDVTWDRTEGPPPMLHVTFQYERVVTYPYSQRTASKVFTVDEWNDLTVPDWGSSR